MGLKLVVLCALFKQASMPSYSYNIRNRLLHFVRVEREKEESYSVRITAAATKFKIPEKTVKRWVFEDLFERTTRRSYEEKLSHRGRKRKITREQEQEIVEWVLRRHYAGEATGAAEIQGYAERQHQLDLSASYVSKLMARNK